MGKARLYKIVTVTGRELFFGYATPDRIKQLVTHYKRWYPTAKAKKLRFDSKNVI